MMACATCKQAHANDAVAYDHDSGKNRVTRYACFRRRSSKYD